MTTQHTHPEHGDVDARDVAEQHVLETQLSQDTTGVSDEPMSATSSSQSIDIWQREQPLTIPALLSFNIAIAPLVDSTFTGQDEHGTEIQHSQVDATTVDVTPETVTDAAATAIVEAAESSVQADMPTSEQQDETTGATDTMDVNSGSDIVDVENVRTLAVDEATPLEPAPLTLTHDESATAPIEASGETPDHPFTEFFEKFRQSEGRSLAPDAFTEFARSAQITESDSAIEGGEEVLPPFDFGEGSSFIPADDEPTSSTLVDASDETAQSPMEAAIAEEKQRVAAVERDESEGGEDEEIGEKETTARPEPAISPLLRPASRHRLRHGASRHREEFVRAPAAEAPSAEAAPAVESIDTAATAVSEAQLQSVEQSPAVEGTQDTTTSEAPRPARRYRFDRPAQQGMQRSYGTYAAPSRNTSNGGLTPLPAQESFSDSSNVPPVTTPVTNAATDTPTAETTLPQEEQALKREAAVLEQSVTPEVASTTSAPAEHGRRKHAQERQQERQREKESQAAAPVQETPESVADIAALVAETHEALQEAPGDIAPEDLPPLEYADLQKASTRRRRRHRNGQAPSGAAISKTREKEAPVQQVSAAAPEPMVAAAPAAIQETLEQNGQDAQKAPYTSPVAATQTPFIPASTPVTPYTLTSGYTLTQMNQGNDAAGPFMGPEPSPARGSVFGRESRTGRAEQVRPMTYSTRDRERERENGATAGLSSASMNHFANVVAQAIQTQSDRMVAELRRANQAPTNVSVSLPPFPSTERVGVFVDVANLLYSARTNRISIDFGKLLDFLRGNRRLVRAQAYCPTSPQPGDEQMFLQAVKGLGYRITTKNYKTFASGAKKADLDLDLCMDVVRLVDGRAVDCIVLVSGDSDFMPMLDYCSDHGVRVEIAAFDEAMSATLRQSCDLFINLSMLEEIRA